MLKLRTTWRRFLRALFVLVAIHFYAWFGLASLLGINIHFRDSLSFWPLSSDALFYWLSIVPIVSISLAVWILFFKKE
jgi:hypothetical protein